MRDARDWILLVHVGNAHRVASAHKRRNKMSLFYCENCQQLEGETAEVEGELVCAECIEPIRRIPEHDSGDMER